MRGQGSFLAPAPEHTCEGLQQHFGHGVTCIQPMFQDYELREAWFWVLTAWGEEGRL